MEQSTDVTVKDLSEILARCVRGDSSAFRPIVEEYQQYVFAVALRVVCDEEEAKDIVQESFIRLWMNLSRYNPTMKFSTWLYTIVTHLCYDHLRSRRARRTTTIDRTDSAALLDIVSDQNPERLYDNKELAGVIRILTEQLPPKQKMVFVLRDLQGLSVGEVCDILHLSEGAVKTNLVYARRYLRQRLAPYISD